MRSAVGGPGAALYRHDRAHADPRRRTTRSRPTSSFVAYTLDNAGPATPTDVLLQWWARLGIGVASSGCTWTATGQDAARAACRRRLRVDRQPADLAGPDRPGIHRSRRHRLQPRHQEGFAEKFFGVKGDIWSGSCIRLYLSRYERWTSPCFWWARATAPPAPAGLSGYLVGRVLSGVVLVSSVLNFETLEFTRGQLPISPPTRRLRGTTRSFRPTYSSGICKASCVMRGGSSRPGHTRPPGQGRHSYSGRAPDLDRPDSPFHRAGSYRRR